jgi:hypothetical protein
MGEPEVRQVSAKGLGALREAVARVLPQRVGRLYEEGTVTSRNAWSDNEPTGPTVSPAASRPGGYEMRWWAPNNDDIVADVFVFSSSRQAARFFDHATSSRCRHGARQTAAARPPLARNLAWVNPDLVGESDVYLLRGARVYRVADVPAGESRGHGSGIGLERAARTIDTLACLLPEAHCAQGSRSVPA